METLDIRDSIWQVLPSFKRRSSAKIYCATLRQAVEKVDKAKRKFGDKDEWKALLGEYWVSCILMATSSTSREQADNSFSLPAEV